MPKKPTKKKAKKAAQPARKVASIAKKRTPTKGKGDAAVTAKAASVPLDAKPTLLARMKELAADAEDDQDIILDLEPQGDSDKNEETREYITTHSDVLPILVFQTGFRRPNMVHSLGIYATSARRRDMWDKHMIGAIGNRETVDDVVWISLQASNFKWKDVEIPIINDDESDTMSIFYNDMKNRDKFFKMDDVPADDRMVANIPPVIMLPTLLGPVFADDTKTAWELYVIVKEWVAPRDNEVAILVRPILEWLLWSSLQGRNMNTSLAETKHLSVMMEDPSTV